MTRYAPRRLRISNPFKSGTAYRDIAEEKLGKLNTLKSFSGKDPEFGQGATIKTFYESKNRPNGCIDWADKPAKQMSEKTVRAHNRVAIKVWKVIDRSKPQISGYAPYKFRSIEIQSPALLEALKDIVKEQGVYLEMSEVAEFKEPFAPLFFCYDKIMNLTTRASEGSVLMTHLDLLTKLMREIFGGIMIRLENLRVSKLISFDLAWTYFPKDSTAYYDGHDCKRLFKVRGSAYKCDSGNKILAVLGQELRFDGRAFEWGDVEFQLPYFEGNRPVNHLLCYPFSFHEDQESVIKRLTARATKALDFQKVTYCEYAGLALSTKDEQVEKHNENGRILIDIYGYENHHLGPQRREEKQKQRNNNYEDDQFNEKSQPDNPKNSTAYLREISDEDAEKNRREMLKRKEDLIFMSPMVSGYSLRSKQWLTFFLEDISPVAWNDEAYDHLVYPAEQKDLVLTFVENHKRTKAECNDVILGKGQGRIFLLSGPPGTGKTLTAEAVADKTRRPLYYLQAEELGITAAQLGAKLKKVFQLATEWNAVILLDEADVFMAERSPADLARNELVSIFLRELEYFQGIIFLTTNLWEAIDRAFRSRVDIHLLFEPLAPVARLQVWRKFLERSLKQSNTTLWLSEADFSELAKWDLNGREIKNAVKTVKNWCDCKGYEISLQRLESGIMVTAPHSIKV